MRTKSLNRWGALAATLLMASVLAGCGSDADDNGDASSSASSQSSESSSASSESSSSKSSQPDPDFYRGVDLSYVNEMEDCGATYYEGETARDPYLIFADRGANLVRLRLWHTPDWQTANPEEDINTYSTLADVKVAIARAKAQDLDVLLDFHYSDTWADPGRQNIPAAWADLVDDTEALSQAVYDYTYNTLTELDDEGLMPEMVQVGNEINGSVMMTPGEDLHPIDWERNSALLNAGIEAVRAAGQEALIQPKIMLHIAEPENIQWWFEAAISNGVTDFDVIGISYYPRWSDYNITQVAELIDTVRDQFEREVIIVETAISWTDSGENVGNDILMPVPGTEESTPEAQADWMLRLTEEVLNHGGLGVVYWEPAWITTDCYNRWDQGSHWDANAFFDADNRVIENGAIRFLSHDYQSNGAPASVTFSVDMSAVDGAEAAYIAGDVTDGIVAMEAAGDGQYTYTTELPAHSYGEYYFLSSDSADSRETVPTECSGLNHDNRPYHITGAEHLYHFPFGQCEATPMTSITFRVDMTGVDAPSGAYITGEFPGEYEWVITPMTAEGNNIYSLTLEVPVGGTGAYYFLKGSDWGDRETVPAECVGKYDGDRLFTAPESEGDQKVIAFGYGTCTSLN